MIPKTRPFRVRTSDQSFDRVIETINRNMVKISCRLDYPQTWCRHLIITPITGKYVGHDIDYQKWSDGQKDNEIQLDPGTNQDSGPTAGGDSQ